MKRPYSLDSHQYRHNFPNELTNLLYNTKIFVKDKSNESILLVTDVGDTCEFHTYPLNFPNKHEHIDCGPYVPWSFLHFRRCEILADVEKIDSIFDTIYHSQFDIDSHIVSHYSILSPKI